MRARHRLLLLCLAGQVLACAPSDFDALTEQARDPAECLDEDCFDSGESGELLMDAGVEDDAAQAEGDPPPEDLDAATLDAALEPLDAAGEDASIKLPADAGVELKDAARDSSMQVLDAATRPPVCDGAMTACRASEVERQMEACGNCSLGVRTRTRTCATDGCSWGAWGAWGACSNPVTECDPNGAAQTQTVACTTCGSRTQSRSCSRDTCKWGAWTNTSACSWCEECSQVVYCDTPADIANRGTWCRQKACSREQALADCMEDVENTCGATTQPFYMEYL